MKYTSLSLLTCALLAAPSAQAVFILVDNFESQVLGDDLDLTEASNGEIWDAPNAIVVSFGGSQAAQFNHTGGGKSPSFVGFGATNEIADGATGTLFFRVSAPFAANYNVGTLDDTPGEFGNDPSFSDFESQLNIGPNDTDFRVRVPDPGGNDTNGPASGSYDPNTFFNVWMVINNDAKTTDYYIGDNPTLGSPDFSSAFRQGDGDPVMGNENPTDAGDIISSFFSIAKKENNLIDDIYIDASNINLSNPIPEPSTLAFGALAALGLLRRRRA